MKPPLRYHGAKWRLAPWVLQSFPPHRRYVGAFGGAAGVLLQKPRSYAEVYNDLDGDVVNFFRILRDPASCAELARLCVLTPYSRAEFEAAYLPSADPIERALRLAVRSHMGFGSGGATKSTTGFRSDSNRTCATAMSVWARYPERLACAGQRLAGVLIEHRDAIRCMQDHDGLDTLHFVDPPYIHSTRAEGRNGRAYTHELTDADHEQLLQVLRRLQGMVVLCGYDHPLYRDTLPDWPTRQTDARISAGRGTKTRRETMWLNPACVNALGGVFRTGAAA